MKRFAYILVALALLAACQGRKPEGGDAPSPGTPVSRKDASYAFGLLIGLDLKSTGVDLDYAAFVSGMKDAMGGKKTKVTPETASETVQAAVVAGREKKAGANLEAGNKFLAKNKDRQGVATTDTGLQYEVVAEGTGPKPVLSDTVKVHYAGTLLDGTEFDSSIARNSPAVFPLENVIPGWREGVLLMNTGAKYRFWIPPSLGYGAEGVGGVIEPNSVLVFEVELLGIENPEQE